MPKNNCYGSVSSNKSSDNIENANKNDTISKVKPVKPDSIIITCYEMPADSLRIKKHK